MKILQKWKLFNNFDPETYFYIEFEKGNITFQSGWEEMFTHHEIKLLSKNGLLRYDKGGEINHIEFYRSIWLVFWLQ